MKSVLHIHWNDWCWSWSSNTLAPWTDSLEKTLMLGKIEGRRRRNNRGWDTWMASPIEWTWVEQALGVGDGQGSLACCSPWGHKKSDTTKRLNWTCWRRNQVSCPMERMHYISYGWLLFPGVLCSSILTSSILSMGLKPLLNSDSIFFHFLGFIIVSLFCLCQKSWF